MVLGVVERTGGVVVCAGGAAEGAAGDEVGWTTSTLASGVVNDAGLLDSTEAVGSHPLAEEGLGVTFVAEEDVEARKAATLPPALPVDPVALAPGPFSLSFDVVSGSLAGLAVDAGRIGVGVLVVTDGLGDGRENQVELAVCALGCARLAFAVARAASTDALGMRVGEAMVTGAETGEGTKKVDEGEAW